MPLFANDWAALLETKGRLQVGRLLQTSVFVASSTRRDEALYNAGKFCQMGLVCQSLSLLGIAQHATLLMPLFGEKLRHGAEG